MFPSEVLVEKYYHNLLKQQNASFALLWILVPYLFSSLLVVIKYEVLCSSPNSGKGHIAACPPSISDMVFYAPSLLKPWDYSNNNNNQALDPNFWGWLWILNRLVRVGHMYSFPSF